MAKDLDSEVRALGFSTEGLIDLGDHVIVEGDIRLSKAALLSPPANRRLLLKGPPDRPVFQFYTNAIVSEANASQIVVDLTNLSGVSDWADAARNAMADFNASGSRIQMSEGSPGDITFSSTDSIYSGDQFDPYNVVARADFPADASSSGKPGPTILVARKYNSYSSGQKEFTIVHELGHTVGLRHDNALVLEGSAGYGANQVPGTNAVDANSVMRRGSGGTTWNGFSQDDVKALRYLYNPMNVSLTGATLIAVQRNCTWSASATGGTAPYTYSWQVVNNSSIQPQTGTGQSFQAFTGYSFSYSPFIVYVSVYDSTGLGLGKATYVYSTMGSNWDHTYCY